MNDATRQLRKKGYTIDEFLKEIGRGSTWWNTHKHGAAKDYNFLMLAISGLKEK